MRKLAELIGLSVKYSRMPLFPFFKKISGLTGNIYGKAVEIYNVRAFGTKIRTVVKIDLNGQNKLQFSAMKKKIGYNFLRALGVPMVTSGNPVLDTKIAFKTNDKIFADKIFAYEEICEKFSDIWSQNFHDGTLNIGTSSIVYYETTNFFTKKKRGRFAIAVGLLCDLFDVLHFHAHSQ